jgi:hypothetical protein
MTKQPLGLSEARAKFIGIDANVDLPINKPRAQLGPGNSHEMTCCTHQPRSATLRALFFSGAIEAQTMLLRTDELRSLKGASYSLTWAMLNWSKAIRISRYAREAGSSMEDRFVITPEITIPGYADF